MYTAQFAVGVGPLGYTAGAPQFEAAETGGMNPEEIKAAMRMKGTTPAMLADELGVANSSVSQVISGRASSARVAGRIAQIIGKPVSAIWHPKKSLKRAKTSTAGAAA